MSRFWEPTKPTTKKPEVTKQSQSKPPQTETQAKNLEASFSDSTKPTRNFADERKLVEQKAKLENLLAKNQQNADLKIPPLKTDFEFLSQSQNQTCYSKMVLVLLLGYPTVCVTRVWAGVDKVWDVEKAQSQKNACKSRRLPHVGCTLCWARFIVPDSLP